jgi:hypothetical protein
MKQRRVLIYEEIQLDSSFRAKWYIDNVFDLQQSLRMLS